MRLDRALTLHFDWVTPFKAKLVLQAFEYLFIHLNATRNTIGLKAACNIDHVHPEIVTAAFEGKANIVGVAHNGSC